MQVDLSACELQWLAATASYFQHFEALEAHRRYRPPLHQRPTGHARAWWRFALAAVRWQRQQAAEPYSWRAVQRRGKQRRSFVHLHKRVVKSGLEKLSEPERVSYTQLCEGLSAADQLLFERIAVAQLSAEMADADLRTQIATLRAQL